ncbi:MAG: lipopolysaccharide transport periplasmic protein LptA [Thiogranum sp.]
MNRLWTPCALLALSLLPTAGWALSSDREQPMLIEADRAELDDTKGISIYRGNVRVTQGTLVLTGAVMTVHNKGNDVEKVIMEGKPATYRQRPDNKDEDVRAKALHMEYFTSPEKIILTGQAEVDQSGDVLRSERIEYDVPTDKVNAGTDQPNERVRITIQPRSGKKKKTPAKP